LDAVFDIEPSSMGKPILRADLTAGSSPPTDLLMTERLSPDDTWVIILSRIDAIAERKNYMQLNLKSSRFT
jgi:hypothetical protein